MAEVMEKIQQQLPPEILRMQKEYGMTPTRYEHNKLSFKIASYLDSELEGTDYSVVQDVYRYLTPDVANLFGNFKNGVGEENFIRGLERYNAPKEFIRRKVEAFSESGVIQAAYAPDIFIIHEADEYDQFAIPLVVFEIMSQNSRQHDLYFKPFFYETIGVQEFYIFETTRRQGSIIKAYRRVDERYEEMRLARDGYFSEAILRQIPRFWAL